MQRREESPGGALVDASQRFAQPRIGLNQGFLVRSGRCPGRSLEPGEHRRKAARCGEVGLEPRVGADGALRAIEQQASAVASRVPTGHGVCTHGTYRPPNLCLLLGLLPH